LAKQIPQAAADALQRRLVSFAVKIPVETLIKEDRELSYILGVSIGTAQAKAS
jgi:hypothetical protein